MRKKYLIIVIAVAVVIAAGSIGGAASCDEVGTCRTVTAQGDEITPPAITGPAAPCTRTPPCECPDTYCFVIR